MPSKPGLVRHLILSAVFAACAAGAAPAQSLSLGWGFSLDTSGRPSSISHIEAVPGGALAVVGFENPATIDVDPGPGMTSFTGGGQAVVFYDSDGLLGWAGQLGAGAQVRIYDIAADSAGNAVVTGDFRGTGDFDPGPGVVSLTSTGADEFAFVVSLDVAGNFRWVASLDASPGAGFRFGSRGNSVAFGPNGDVHVAGYFEGTVDLDPGPGVVSRSSQPGGALFVLELDNSGAFVRTNTFTASGGARIDVEPSGVVRVVSTFGGLVDFDPTGSGRGLLDSTLGSVFILELDPNGAFLGVRQFGGGGGIRPSVFDLYRTASGETYLTGAFGGWADLDPGPGTSPPVSGPAVYVLKLDASGQYDWSAVATGNFGSADVTVSENGDVYVSVVLGGTVTFGTDPGSPRLTSVNSPDSALWRLDAAGATRDATLFSGQASTFLLDVAAGFDGEVYVGGLTRSVLDVDPGLGSVVVGRNGRFEAWLARYGSLELRAAQPAGPGTPVTFENRHMTPGREYFNLFSFETCAGAPGSGPLAGLCASSPPALQFLLTQLTAPLGTPLFHFTTNRLNLTWSPMSVGPITLDAVCIGTFGGLIDRVSLVSRITIL